jgi:kynureninase
MLPKFSPTRGAQGYQQSNPSVLATVSLLGSLQVFKEAGMMQLLRKRSIRLTAMLETLLVQSRFFVPLQETRERHSDTGNEVSADKPGFTIITPSDPEARGAMLSLLVLPLTNKGIMEKVFDIMMSYGVVGDKREPSVIRLSPAPLFNSFDDCQRAADAVEKAFELLSA